MTSLKLGNKLLALWRRAVWVSGGIPSAAGSNRTCGHGSGCSGSALQRGRAVGMKPSNQRKVPEQKGHPWGQ